MSIGGASLVLIVIAALLIFGPNKLPELGRAAGKTLREFKQATNGLVNDENEKTNRSEKNE